MPSTKETRNEGLKAIPSVVQLPGGVQLRAVPFKIIERNPDGSPKTFEILPPNTMIAGKRDMCAFFADESALRSPKFAT